MTTPVADDLSTVVFQQDDDDALVCVFDENEAVARAVLRAGSQCCEHIPQPLLFCILCLDILRQRFGDPPVGVTCCGKTLVVERLVPVR